MKTEFIETTFNAISQLITLSTMAEFQARTARNIGDELAEKHYLQVYDDALYCARTLYFKAVDINET